MYVKFEDARTFLEVSTTLDRVLICALTVIGKCSSRHLFFLMDQQATQIVLLNTSIFLL